MSLGRLGWSALIVLPLVVCAVHLHGKRGATADNVKEVNRCLAIVRVATFRRKNKGNAQEQERREATGIRRESPALVLPFHRGERPEQAALPRCASLSGHAPV